MPRRLAPSHASLALPCRLVRILRAIVEPLVPPMRHAGEGRPLGGTIARELVGDDDTRDIGQPLEPLTEELPRGCGIATGLHQDSEHGPVLIDGPPAVVLRPVAADEDRVEMPRIGTVKLSLLGGDGDPKVGNDRRIRDRIRPVPALATARTGPAWGGFVQSRLNVTVPSVGPRALPRRRWRVVRDDHTWHVREALQQRAQGLHGRRLVAAGLHQDIAHVPILVDRAPQVVLHAVDADEHLVAVPRVAGPGPTPAQLVRLSLPELTASLAHRLVRDDHAALAQQLLHVTIPAGEAEVAPDAVGDNLRREAVALVPIGELLFIHGHSIADRDA